MIAFQTGSLGLMHLRLWFGTPQAGSLGGLRCGCGLDDR